MKYKHLYNNKFNNNNNNKILLSNYNNNKGIIQFKINKLLNNKFKINLKFQKNKIKKVIIIIMIIITTGKMTVMKINKLDRIPYQINQVLKIIII